MAIDWDKLQIKVIDDDHIPITDDYKYTMSSDQRMVIFAGRRGEQGPAGPAGPAGPSGASSWGAIEGDIENQTDLANALDEKINDAPSDNKEYVRKNGAWTESSGGGGGGETPTWGEITGTLSDQTDLQNALNAKANVADLGDLATQDTVDYQTEVTNKPTLGTMSAVNDAPSDSKEYVRKNGAWTEATGGGGGGITSVSWGDINGTLANQTDLQTALDAKADESDLGELATKDTVDYQTEVTNKPSTFPPEAHIHDDRYYTESEIDALLEEKAPVIIGPVPVKLSGTYIVVPTGAKPIDFKATLQVTQTGSGTPSASNIRPFESAESCIVVISTEYGDYASSWETRPIPLPSAMYGGIVDVLNGTVTITHGHIASYNGETLPGVWYSDRDVYASGTTPTLGAEVVYELETPIEQTCSSFMPTMFSNRDTYLWANHKSTRLSITNYTVAGAIDIYEQGIIDTKTYIDTALAGKQNTLTFDSAPTSGSTNPVTSGGVKTALDAKQDTLTFDTTPTANSANPVTSGGIKTYVDSHDDFKITGTVSSSGYTLTDSRINDEHWEVDWVQFGTSSNVIAGGSWSTDIASHTLTLSATYSGSTSVVVNMHWVQ